MKQIQADLWETEVESPFPGLTTHAYLLQRDAGNVLFYNTSHLPEIEALESLGGVAYQYLSHRDEMGDSLPVIRERYGSRLGCHQREQEDCAPYCQPDILFGERCHDPEDIEIIPTPGHSPGSTCFLATSTSGKRYLFTGDTLYFDDEDQWTGGFIPGVTAPENIDTLVESLTVLRSLAPDVVLSSAFGGSSGHQVMNAGEWPEHVDRAIAGLRDIQRSMT